MRHSAARSTAVATHLTDTNCFGGQVIPVTRTAFRRARYLPPPRRRMSTWPVTSPPTEGVTGDHKSTAITRTSSSCQPTTTAAKTRCDAVLSRVLLECTAAGFATCTLTHMIEVHASREIVRRLIGRPAEPQVLIRAGSGPEISPPPVRTPRRPLADVLRMPYPGARSGGAERRARVGPTALTPPSHTDLTSAICPLRSNVQDS